MEQMRVAKVYLNKAAARAERFLADLSASTDDDLQSVPIVPSEDLSSPQYYSALHAVTMQVSVRCTAVACVKQMPEQG